MTRIVRAIGTAAFVLAVTGAGYPPVEGRALANPVAPTFVLTDQSGTSHRLADYRGRVVLLNFWATWCSDCGAEIPWLRTLSARYGPEGLTVIGVAVDDHWPSIVPAVARWQITYPVLLGTEAMTAQYGVHVVPVTIAIGRDGRIADTERGLADEDATEATVVHLLGAGPSRG